MMRARLGDRRGAVLIQTAVTLVGLLGFSAYSVDYGVYWVARRQAQNAADAAALAAATSMAFGDPNNQGRTRAVARTTAVAHSVWGVAPSVTDADITIGACPENSPGSPTLCVKVDVTRDDAHGNPLPSFFGKLIGVSSQGVRATATAQVVHGTTVVCVKPWAVPDKWVEVHPGDATWTTAATFNRYNTTASDPKKWPALINPDYYEAAASNQVHGSGFRAPNDVGVRIALRVAKWDHSTIGWGSNLRIELPTETCGNSGNQTYKCNIETCNPTPVRAGQVIPTAAGDGGSTVASAVASLTAGDTSTWVCADGGSPVGRDCMGYPSSDDTKRLVAIVGFDVQKMLDDLNAGLISPNKLEATVTRILGFFIESWDNNYIYGRFSYLPAARDVSKAIPDTTSFVRKVVLIR
jgi:Flp pilus assembly protein TadG